MPPFYYNGGGFTIVLQTIRLNHYFFNHSQSLGNQTSKVF